MEKNKPNVNVLLVDIETSPLKAWIWSLGKQTVTLNQLDKDWNIISFCAKWLTLEDGTVYGPHDKVMYYDLREQKNFQNDKKLLTQLWKLFNSADIIIGQNSDKFDIKKINSRFAVHKMAPPSMYRTLDTVKIARKYFGFTSNKLEYLLKTICTKYRKLQHKSFPGLELWKECLKGNKLAWKEMEDYNKGDVLGLEELYNNLAPWENKIDFSVYSEDLERVCSCGSKDFQKRGFKYTNKCKYQTFRCKSCGKQLVGSKNLIVK